MKTTDPHLSGVSDSTVGTIVGTTATAAGVIGTAAAGGSVAAAAALGAALGGLAISVPVFGTAVAAVAAAIAATAAWLTGYERENFNTNSTQSTALLLLWEISPGFAFVGLDNARNPGQAAFLARVLMVRAGLAVDPATGKFPDGADAVNRYLYGPNGKPGSTENLGPGDPQAPLTNPAVLTPYFTAFNAYKASGASGDDWASKLPPLLTPADAAKALAWLRAHPSDFTFAVQTLHSGNSKPFRSSLRRVRKLAGEDVTKHDPILEPIVGDLTGDPKLAGADASAGPVAGAAAGAAGAGVSGAAVASVVVAGALALGVAAAVFWPRRGRR